MLLFDKVQELFFLDRIRIIFRFWYLTWSHLSLQIHLRSFSSIIIWWRQGGQVRKIEHLESSLIIFESSLAVHVYLLFLVKRVFYISIHHLFLKQILNIIVSLFFILDYLLDAITAFSIWILSSGTSHIPIHTFHQIFKIEFIYILIFWFARLLLRNPVSLIRRNGFGFGILSCVINFLVSARASVSQRRWRFFLIVHIWYKLLLIMIILNSFIVQHLIINIKFITNIHEQEIIALRRGRTCRQLPIPKSHLRTRIVQARYKRWNSKVE